MVDTNGIALLHREYELPVHIGNRTGCRRLWGESCSRIGHLLDHQIGGYRLTVAEIKARLEDEHSV